jgi:hypothetical protein
MARVLLTKEEKRANAKRALDTWKDDQPIKDKSVMIRSQKVSDFIKYQKIYSFKKLGYLLPIGSLLVAALEYVHPMIESNELKIIRKGGNVQIIKTEQ